MIEKSRVVVKTNHEQGMMSMACTTDVEEEHLIAGSDRQEIFLDLGNENHSHKFVLKGLFQNGYLVAASILASVGGILFGYDIGVISGAIVQLRTFFDLSCFQQEMTIGSVIIGAFLTSLLSGFLLDYFGRKVIIIAASLLYAFGAISATLAPSYAILISARLILGAAISLSSASECVYVSEISPTQYRGTLVSFNELGITVGFLLAYCSNAIFANDIVNGWRWMFGLSLIFAVVMLAIVCWLPRSPRHLLVKGRHEEAKAALCKLRQCDPSSDTFDQEWTVMRSHAVVSDTVRSSVCDLFRNPSSCYSIFIAFSLMLIQQLTGQPNLLFYASTVLVSFGFSVGTMASVCTVGIGVAKLLSTIVCISIIEKYERKTFLIAGSLVMFASLLIISLCAMIFNVGVIKSCTNSTDVTVRESFASVDTGGVKWIVLVSLVIFVSAYAFSFGPVSWIFLSEIFPTNIRGKAFSLSISLNWFIHLMISSTFLDFANACGGVGVPYLLNSILALASVGFLYRYLPKTRGKSLEHIQDDMKMQTGKLCCRS